VTSAALRCGRSSSAGFQHCARQDQKSRRDAGRYGMAALPSPAGALRRISPLRGFKQDAGRLRSPLTLRVQFPQRWRPAGPFAREFAFCQRQIKKGAPEGLPLLLYPRFRFRRGETGPPRDKRQPFV
jgi:hypothetical protein